MATGVDIRAQIDTENVKALLLINGGGGVALLAALPQFLEKPGFEPLINSILWCLLCFQIGLLAAVIYNRLRRICSLRYDQHNFTPPACEWFGPRWPKDRFGFRWMKEPCVCCVSILFMWLSVGLFFVGGVIVFCGGREWLNNRVVVMQGTKPVTVPSSKGK